MTKKELDEEIEFVHRNGRYVHRLIRSLDVIWNVICNATNTYTNLSTFMNDYISLYKDKLIDEETYQLALNDLYLLALLHTGYEDYEEENDK